MALPTIAPSDFTGFIKITADTYAQSKLQDYIDSFYPKYVKDILGAYALNFMQNNALTDKWTDLMNGQYYYNTAKERYESIEGVVYVIRRLLYFEFVRDNFINTSTGNVRNFNENAETIPALETNAHAISRWHQGIEQLKDAIDLFIDNYTDYESTITSFTDNGGGSYTIFTSDTIYLIDGDSVSIGNVEYVISSLVANTSFNITAGTGETFDGVFVYSPYEDVVLNTLDYALF